MNNNSAELVESFLSLNPVYRPIDGLIGENALHDLADYLSELAGGISPPPPPTINPKNTQENM